MLIVLHAGMGAGADQVADGDERVHQDRHRIRLAGRRDRLHDPPGEAR